MRQTALLVALVAISLAITPPTTAKDDSNCASQLPKQIEEILNNPLYKTATWGIEIVGYQGEKREELFALLQDNFRVPASNTKLLTTSALFSIVNVDDLHFETPIFYSSNNGDTSLCIKGSGDPSLSYSQMQEAAKLLSLGGIGDISNLTLDNTLYFSDYAAGQPFLGSWQWEDITAYYGAHPNSAIVEENAFYVTVTGSSSIIGIPPTVEFSVPSSGILVDNTAVTVGTGNPVTLQVHWQMGAPDLVVEGYIPSGQSVTYHLAAINSDEYYLSLFRQALEMEGIKANSAHFGKCNTSSKLVGVMRSQTWNKLFNHTLQESDNLYAEAWIRKLALLYTELIDPSSGDQPTLATGLSAVTDYLTLNLGVDASCHRQVDGSGLSVQNLVTPDCLIQLLKGIDNLPNGQEYFDFLPLAGESGTLSSRFVGTSAQGRVRAKTGTITGVNALSGIVDNPSYDTLLFSILVNESNQFASTIRQGIDAIVELLPDLDPTC